MSDKEDLTEKRFGRLKVLEPQEEGFSLCRCDCGTEVRVRNTLLTSGYLSSCGCGRGDSKKKDITGMRSGMVVALEPTQTRKSGSVLWRCRCDCGKELLTEAYKITGGLLNSCGCSRKAPPDLTGQRFGRLTALERLDQKRGNSWLWRCRCDCGRETVVSANALCGGSTKSCGCARQDACKRRAKDITGQRFSRLVALEPLDKRMGGSVVWLCRCDCGKETEASYNSLVHGNTKSCGCLLQENRSLEKLRYIDGTCVDLVEKQRLRKNNTSGYTGVVSYRGRWRAQITFKHKAYNLGNYDRIEDAVKARKQAEERIFGNFLDWYYETHPQKTPEPKNGDPRDPSPTP